MVLNTDRDVSWNKLNQGQMIELLPARGGGDVNSGDQALKVNRGDMRATRRVSSWRS